MKRKRHDKILELIVSKSICTQEELLQDLKQAGITVTQATISRDIKELHLTKELNEDGLYRYVTGEGKAIGKGTPTAETIFQQSVLQVASADNMVSIKCHPGMAGAACAMLDSMTWDGVVGTLAGNDTIFVLMRSKEDATTFSQEIEQYLIAQS